MKTSRVVAIAALTGILLPVLGVAGGASAGVTQPGELSATVIDDYMRDYAERTGLPGAMVAVTKGDTVVHVAGYGHTADGEPITKDTLMPLASISKSFTALAVLRLADQRKIDLDAPVRTYLPEFTMADPRAARITVRQLLQQTSGMSDRTFPELTLPAPGTLEDAVAMLRTAPLATEPGTKKAYHNPNYVVAARLVEAVTGTSFADHMAAKMFRPLGMTSTSTVDTTLNLPGEGAGYIRAYGRLIRRVHTKWFINGSYGVVSTADNMAKWLITQNGSGRVFPKATVKVAQTPSGVGGSTYGMGWDVGRTVAGSPRLRHTGWLLTHNSAQTLLPASGYGIAVVTNTGMISGDDALLISDGLIDILEGRPDAAAAPFTDVADPWLGGLSLLNLALGVLGLYRARTWARRHAHRPLWRRLLRLVPYSVPIVVFAGLAQLIGILMNRVGTLSQITYVWLALYVWAATAALAAGAVIVARSIHTIRVIRSARRADQETIISHAGSDLQNGHAARGQACL